ncbi:integrase core domain-containing protein [Thermoanaerobacterium sp. DL9XJH110]|uniref:integrase core domain-containing protein n=1 Tax=Thermoanaerobacterium sp. DL9XJH110 TaxID=3386643 RepID=UPI003BB7EA0A
MFHERIPVRSPERNPKIERFHRTLKEEYVNLNNFESYKSFFKGLDDYIKFYLCERPHDPQIYDTFSIL